MVFRPRLVVGLCVLLFAILTVVPYAFLEWGIAASDFQQLAEAKAGEFLKAKVEIGKIRVRFPNRVVLSDLKVFRGDSPQGASRLEIGQLIFRYDFAQLFSRNLKTPSGVTLRAPKMLLSDSGFPYSFFQSFQFEDAKGASRETMNLEFAGGEIRYPVPGFGAELFLTDIRGKIAPDRNGKIQVNLRSNVTGALNAKLRIKGEVDPLHQEHRLELQLESSATSSSGPLNARIRWEGDTLWLDRLRAKVYGWDSEMHGKIDRLSKDPAVDLDFDLGRRAQHAGFSLKSDFKTSDLQAGLRIPGRELYQVSGKISREGAKIIFPELKFETGHHGNGSLDFSTGDIQFLFEKENQRIGASLNMKKPGIRFDVHLDHVPVAGLDLVTSGMILLNPLPQGLGSRSAKFQGEFQTDYFILEYTPFQDLNGRFEISTSGIRHFSASWGEVFDLTGNLRFARPPQMGFSLRVNQFDLKGVKQFAAKPLPKVLGGLLEGRLKIDGALTHPEISGKFTIKDGQVGKLEYDLGILQFHGFPPYLPLEDSRILKGRTTLFLGGALDFRMRNMFSGIRLQTDDKLVIWKGLEMNTSESQGDVEIESSFSKLPIFTIKPGQGVSSPGVQKEDQDANDRYVAAGPKFKF